MSGPSGPLFFVATRSSRLTGVSDKASVKAVFLAAGPRETYLERHANASERRLGTVLALAAIGLPLLPYAFWEFRQIFRK